MKNYIKGITFGAIILMASLSFIPNSKGDIKAKINNYFYLYLDGNDKDYKKSEKIDLDNIDKYTDMVWGEWVEANQNYSEQKLENFDNLSKQLSSSWEIPPHLEPDVKMPYYFGYKGEQPKSGYPLFIYLHGSGNKDREWSTGHKLATMFDDAPSAYFIPQIPSEKQYRWWQKSKQYAIEKLLRLTLIRGDIDANRLYLFGISEGGYGSQRLASFYADYLAGAGPMAGGEPLRNAPVDNCRNIAYSMLTGANDVMFGRNDLTKITKEQFQEFQKEDNEGYNHRIEIIPGMGHQIDYSPTTLWLKDKIRNPHPKRVVWENFEMDGIYRKGFYNIAVIEPSSDDTEIRTRYIMEIEDNNINLSVDLVEYSVTARNKWNIETRYNKNYTKAEKGKILIYLNNELVNLSKDVTVTVNGKRVYSGMVTPNLKNLVNSCKTFYDPERLYPAAIEVTI